ncbi:hypothetical protein QX776_18610 [Alteromonadaceae bacterium BrNp21-10]|nr:hypothetical protein [Alteromonadaceae bacterium BrNp21-10]
MMITEDIVRIRRHHKDCLLALWRQGAGVLAGAKPEHAYFIKVGLNETMTSADINQGRLIVQLGVSMLRPAEFNVLTIEQKMSQP